MNIPIMAGYPSNLAKKFSPTKQFPQHILPLLPLYNAQWWVYESLTAIVLVNDGLQSITLLYLVNIYYPNFLNHHHCMWEYLRHLERDLNETLHKEQRIYVILISKKCLFKQ